MSTQKIEVSGFENDYSRLVKRREDILATAISETYRSGKRNKKKSNASHGFWGYPILKEEEDPQAELISGDVFNLILAGEFNHFISREYLDELIEGQSSPWHAWWSAFELTYRNLANDQSLDPVLVDDSINLSSTTTSDEGHVSGERIISMLQDSSASTEEKRWAVLNSEVVSFSSEQVASIRNLLKKYVLKRRNSNDPNELVAVGAAIRKLVVLLDASDLGIVSEILDAKHRTPIPLEVELEVAKTVVRKLISTPPERDDSETELANCLFELTRTYLNPRMLPREKYGAATLNAVLALLLLRSRYVDEIIELVRNGSLPWFTQLLCRRAKRIQGDLMAKWPEAEVNLYCQSLQLLIDEFGSDE